MPGSPRPLVLAVSESSVVNGVIAGGATVAIVVVALLVLGLVLLFRRRSGAQPSSATGLDSLETRANVLLVRTDQSLAASDDELGFAVAQFGERATASFADAVTGGKQKLTAAFRLKQQLDDAVPESAQRRREWTLQIIALCEAAQAGIDAQNHDFSALRTQEVNAPASIASLRSRIASVTTRLGTDTTTLQRLRDQFDASLSSPYDSALDEARSAIESASRSTDAAETGISPSGVNTVATDLADAEQYLHNAIELLDAVDGAALRLDEAKRGLDKLVAASAADLAEARTQRESAPDAATGAAIIDAIDQVERALSAIRATGALNPPLALDQLGAAMAALDTALASARNQAQRLEHARIALAGALVSAKSQLEAVRALKASGRRVGADARTRIAEAERQLELAETEADPVEALDAARRAVTHARDADALARYDGRF